MHYETFNGSVTQELKNLVTVIILSELESYILLFYCILLDKNKIMIYHVLQLWIYFHFRSSTTLYGPIGLQTSSHDNYNWWKTLLTHFSHNKAWIPITTVNQCFVQHVIEN